MNEANCCSVSSGLPYWSWLSHCCCRLPQMFHVCSFWKKPPGKSDWCWEVELLDSLRISHPVPLVESGLRGWWDRICARGRILHNPLVSDISSLYKRQMKWNVWIGLLFAQQWLDSWLESQGSQSASAVEWVDSCGVKPIMFWTSSDTFYRWPWPGQSSWESFA